MKKILDPIPILKLPWMYLLVKLQTRHDPRRFIGIQIARKEARWDGKYDCGMMFLMNGKRDVLYFMILIRTSTRFSTIIHPERMTLSTAKNVSGFVSSMRYVYVVDALR